MYGTFTLIEANGSVETGKRLYLDGTRGKNEAWLRDTLFEHPDLIPVAEIDATFGKLIPLCKEMRTKAGPVDAVFINEHGRLTIVECKLWNNPEARRKVVAQALDYVSAISNWTYADLQRQVSMASGQKGNIPYESVRRAYTSPVPERDFIDAVSRSLREGRLLVLIAGDGIREGVASLAELVSRNATKAFSFGLIEVAIYEFSNGRLMIQPRILAHTEVIERQFIAVTIKDSNEIVVQDDEDVSADDGLIRGSSRLHLKSWWQPILDMKFDDPEQDPPFWAVTNNVVLNTPYPGIVIKAWSKLDNSGTGVFLSQNRAGAIDAVGRFIKRDGTELAAELPDGTQIQEGREGIKLANFGLITDDEKYSWLQENLNAFVNALRPRLKAWHQEART